MSRVPEMTNQLLREIKKSIPYWKEKSKGWDNFTQEEKNEHISFFMLDKDDEIRSAFMMLVDAIIEEHKETSPESTGKANSN